MIANVLHVVSRLPVGGVETTIQREIMAYDKSRFHASVCCIKEGGTIAEELMSAGYKVDVLREMKGHGFSMDAVRELYRLMKRDNIHILRTHQYHAGLYGRVAAIFAGVRVIVPTFHNLYRSPSRPKMHRSMFNFVLGFFSDAVVGVSDAVCADIVKYDRISRTKVKTIYNGIRLQDFDRPHSRGKAKIYYGIPEDVVAVGTLGRLTEQKGHRYLIEAMAETNNACLLVAGDGPLRAELEAVARSKQVKIKFLGPIRHEDVPEFLKAIDIFCFPSLWEGFGIALVEAMAAGLPVIASDLQPLREVLDAAGIYVPVAETGSIAETINRLVQDPGLRAEYSLKSAKRAALFSVENMVRSYEELFEGVLGDKDAGSVQ